MVSLFLFAFLAGLLALGMRRPFVWVLAYCYVDIVAPQKISYFLLSSLPISLIVFVLAFAGWALADDKRDSALHPAQGLIVALLLYCGYTTLVADFPVEAAEKWSWVWKALFFAIFLPLTLRTRLRIEATALVMVLSVAAIIITGGIKTAGGGGGYGMLQLLVNDNTGLNEGSIISAVAISVIPLVVWLAKHGTVFPPDWRVKLFATALVFACLLIPIGTQARTGLLCIGVMVVLSLRTVKRRFLYMGLIAAAGLIAVPFLPQSYTARMSTIENHEADQSASTRLAIWAWTIEYAQDHPLGGGFEVYLGNKIRLETKTVEGDASNAAVSSTVIEDKSRAFPFQLLRDAGRTGLAGVVPVVVAATVRHLADGAPAPTLEGSQRTERKVAGAAGQCLAAGPDHLSCRRGLRGHCLPALHPDADRPAMRPVELSAANRCAASTHGPSTCRSCPARGRSGTLSLRCARAPLGPSRSPVSFPLTWNRRRPAPPARPPRAYPVGWSGRGSGPAPAGTENESSQA
jgi:probable O-glycosylation ligase (exosortase A-associated)